MWTTRTTLVATMTLALFASLVGFVEGEPLIYDSFDYSNDQNIAGQNGGIGWTGNWANTFIETKSYDDGLDWGPLITEGGRVRATGHGGISRPIGSTLANAGLLDDGATVWFSFVADLRGQSNITNLEYHVALATDPFLTGWGPDTKGNERYSRMHHLLNNGEGIGVSQGRVNRYIDPSWIQHAQFRTAYWQDDGLNDNDAGDGPDGYGNLHKSGDNSWFGITQETALLVGKIDWGVGGAGETLTLYAPGEDFYTLSTDTIDLGASIQTLVSPDLDQAAFDTISIMWKDTPGIDEIRFGATMLDVLPLQMAPVPEPSSLVLAALGLIGAIFFGRRRRKTV